MTKRDRHAVLDLVRTMLAADCSCDQEDFSREETIVRVLSDSKRLRRYPQVADPFIVTMGLGTVVATNEPHVEWANATLGGLAREAIFSAQTMNRVGEYLRPHGKELYGPSLFYVCGEDDLIEPGVEHEVVLLDRDNLTSLYAYPEFRYALNYQNNPLQPDVLATAVYNDGRPVGVAGASADAPDLWQIGIDVLPQWRIEGMGKALVWSLAKAIFSLGRVPYYGTSAANIRSQRLATSVGFLPTWTEVHARNIRHN